MAKKHKIKHYYKQGGQVFRAKPHPLSIVVSILVLVALVFIGASIYPVVFDKIMGLGNAPQSQPANPEPLPGSDANEEPAREQPAETPQKAEYGKLHGVYAPPATVSDQAAFRRFLDSVADSDINAVMVDIKNAQGQVLFASKNENALKWGAVAPGAPDLGEVAGELERRGLSLIVREWAFRDETAARGNRANAIHYQGSDEMLWLDNTADAGGKPWLNPYSRGAKDYLIGLAEEAAEAGAALVVLESVQFPDNSNMGNTNFGPDAQSADRRQALLSFVAEITAAVKDKGARLGVYYPAVSMTQPRSAERYGGSPLLVADELLLLGVLPQQFEGGYSEGGLEIAQPLQNPALAVKTALEFAEKSLREAGRSVTLIPLIQGGSESAVTGMAYSAEQIRAQIDAAGDLGLEEYILYQTNGAYALQ